MLFCPYPNHISSCPLLSCSFLITSHPSLVCPVLSCPVFYCTIPCSSMLSYSIQSCTVLSCPIPTPSSPSAVCTLLSRHSGGNICLNMTHEIMIVFMFVFVCSCWWFFVCMANCLCVQQTEPSWVTTAHQRLSLCLTRDCLILFSPVDLQQLNWVTKMSSRYHDSSNVRRTGRSRVRFVNFARHRGVMKIGSSHLYDAF